MLIIGTEFCYHLLYSFPFSGDSFEPCRVVVVCIASESAVLVLLCSDVDKVKIIHRHCNASHKCKYPSVLILPEVQGTNDHATLSKLSTVRMGYFEDRFLPYFVSKRSRRAPVIHR